MDRLLTHLAAAQARAAEPCQVYRLDAAQHTLYVGMTTNLQRRLREHRRKPWSTEVREVHATEPLRRDLARLVEALEMQRTRPAHSNHDAVTPPYVNGDWATASTARFLLQPPF